MSDPLTTSHLKLPYLASAQAQKHVTHNEALRLLDTAVQLAVLDATLTAPPGSPAEADRHIVAATATGAWAGKEGAVATWVDGAWAYAAPDDGWLAFDVATETILVRLSGVWQAAAAVPGTVDKLGINATADDTNRLAVCSAAVLFSGIEAADGGSGDVRFTVNKETDADTASLLFQSGWSGRAEIGLAGDTDLVFKVSPDGSAWTEAIRIDKDTGLPTIRYDNGTSGLTATHMQAAIDEIAAGGGGGAVASVFGRTGAVAAAASDYDASQVDNDSGVAGATVKDALNTLASAKQAADSDLTAIAGLTPANDDIVQRKAGAWTNRTPAQVKSDLSLAKSDIGLANVDNTADTAKPVSTAAQTALDLKAPLASPALTGTPTVPTAAVDTSTTQAASTAFVLGQASAAGDRTPAADGTAARGSSTHFVRADHIHPTDTSRAPLASPALTGTPTVPTAAVDTNTTQAASTAFVLGQASATGDGTSAVDGTAGRGASTHFARADHVHPTDTSRAPTASPTFTGTVTLPDGTVAYAKLAGAAVAAGTDFLAATASKLIDAQHVWDAGGVVALSDGATIAVDLSTGINFGGASGAKLSLGGNRTLSNPTNVKVGQSGIFAFGATTSTRTLTLGSNFKAPSGVESFPISIATTETVFVPYWVFSSTLILILGVLRTT